LAVAPRPDPGDETSPLLQIIGHVDRVELDRVVEKAKENDEEEIDPLVDCRFVLLNQWFTKPAQPVWGAKDAAVTGTDSMDTAK